WNKTQSGYAEPFLKSIFTPDELDHVYQTGAIARSVGLNTNPSGTAGVTGAMQDIQKPIRSLLPKGGAAWLTKSPGFNNWLMKGSQGSRLPLSLLLGATSATRGDEE